METLTHPEPVMPNCPVLKLLQGQTALVTGASSGIGRAVAIALGKAGADVVVNYVSGEGAAQSVVEEINSCVPGRSYTCKADISKEEQVHAMFAEMIDKLGAIDILINNAGLQSDAPFDQMALANWEKVIGVNLTGQFLCTREAVRQFKRQGVRPEVSCAAGKVICISSVHEVIPWSCKLRGVEGRRHADDEERRPGGRAVPHPGQ
jgi:glucose 1-dehydrogenase